jgi:hypothetical protein
MSSEHVYGLQTYLRIFIVVFFGTLFLWGAWTVGRDLASSFEFGAPIGAYAAVIVTPLFVVDALRYRITVTDEYVEKRSVRTQKLRFDEIVSLRFSDMQLRLRSEKRSMYLPGGIPHGEDLYEDFPPRIK